MTATLPAAVRRTRTTVDRQEISARLLRSAATRSYDPAVDIDWDAPVRHDLDGLSPEWSTLYGTPL